MIFSSVIFDYPILAVENTLLIAFYLKIRNFVKGVKICIYKYAIHTSNIHIRNL